ncbi:MAG: SlyX family protein, partial [Castellaniella sp.]
MNETDHDSDAALEKRLVDLEVKAAYADDLLDRLNHTIFRQQQQIESLARELLALR